MGVCASQRIPLSVLEGNPHKGLAREISHKTGRGKEGLRAEEKESELRSGQNSSREKLGEADRQERPVKIPV